MSSFGDAIECQVCKAPTRTRFRNLYDDRYGYPGHFALQACDSCGHLHVLARFTSEDLGRLYTQYYPRGSFSAESFAPETERTGIKSWLDGDRASAFRWVPRDVRVLDIGCGVGATLAYHRNRGCQAVGVETDENVRPIAERFGLDIRFGVFDGAGFPAESFDYVTLDQVAEHVVDPHALMQGVARVLKSGGTAIVTTPNARGLAALIFGRYWLNWHTPYHLQFYTRRSFDIVAARAGLRLVKRRTITASEWQYFQWCHFLSYPREGAPSVFWTADGASLPKIRRVGLRLAAIARRLGVHQAISRLFDAVGLGDNQVFVLSKP